MLYETTVIRERRKDFIDICEIAEVPENKIEIYCNCYINYIIYGCVYPREIQESLKPLIRLMKIQGKKYKLGYETGYLYPEYY